MGLFNVEMTENSRFDAELNEKLATSGFRFTAQRRHVYNVLVNKRDHPTAEEVFIRAKAEMPEISMATVYNCLDALVKCGLVKQVNHDRSANRYCSNMQEHCHYYCTDCNRVFDVDLKARPLVPEADLPETFKPDHIDVAMRGHCPDPECATHTKD